MPITLIPENNIFSQIEASGQLYEAASHGAESAPLKLQAEAVVVGAGAGGSVAARELAQAGFDVLLVEAGPFWRPHRDFNQREETMNPALLYHGGARSNHDYSLMITHGKGVGGSTVHNICLSVDPPKAIVERWQDEFGFAWSRDQMQPFVDRVRMNLGINQIQPQQLNRNNQILKAGADALGWSGFIPEHNRLGCLECGFCVLGCAFNRKQSALITYVPQAVWSGARLLADTEVDRIIHDGTRVQGITGHMVQNGKILRPVHISAKIVVSAGGAILTPALLKRSRIPDPNDLIGSTFRTHPAVPLGGFASEDVIGWKGVPQTYIVDHFASFLKTGYGGFEIFPIFGHPGQTGALVPGIGTDYVKNMGQYKKLVAVAPMIHDETTGQISVDRHGEPVIRYFPNSKDQQELLAGVRASAELLLAAGVSEVFVPYLDHPLSIRRAKDLDTIKQRGIVPNRILLNAVHPQGSVRMADDPKKGSVDTNGAYRHLKNLYVSDASLFPTSIGTAPTVSIMTLASMVAAAMIRDRDKLL